MAMPGQCLTIIPLTEPRPDPHLQAHVQAGFSLFPSLQRYLEPGLPHCPCLPAPDWDGGTFWWAFLLSHHDLIGHDQVEIMTSLACQLISSAHKLKFMFPLLGQSGRSASPQFGKIKPFLLKIDPVFHSHQDWCYRLPTLRKTFP